LNFLTTDMLAQKQNQPTYMRYNRVHHVLSQELAFKDRLTGKTEAVFKPDGSTELFSPEVIKVTQALHDSGKDAHKCQKIDVIRVAVKVFGLGGSTEPETTTGNVAVPEKPVSLTPRNGVVHPAPQRKPVAKPKPAAKAAKPKVEAVAPPVQPAPTAPIVVPTPAPAPAQTPAPEATQKVDKEAAVKGAVEAMMTARPESTAPFNAYISMYSLALSIVQLCDMYDNQPGAKDRMKKLEELIADFHKYTSSKSAKESQKA
jgi:hypothetical protein